MRILFFIYCTFRLQRSLRNFECMSKVCVTGSSLLRNNCLIILLCTNTALIAAANSGLIYTLIDPFVARTSQSRYIVHFTTIPQISCQRLNYLVYFMLDHLDKRASNDPQIIRRILLLFTPSGNWVNILRLSHCLSNLSRVLVPRAKYIS